MAVSPGEIIHMDENGAVKFPASVLDDVIKNAQNLRIIEEKRQAQMRQTQDLNKIIDIMAGLYDD